MFCIASHSFDIFLIEIVHDVTNVCPYVSGVASSWVFRRIWTVV